MYHNVEFHGLLNLSYNGLLQTVLLQTRRCTASEERISRHVLLAETLLAYLVDMSQLFGARELIHRILSSAGMPFGLLDTLFLPRITRKIEICV